MAAQGIDAVTIERVAEKAGIAKGAVYLCFRNMKEMMLAALKEVASGMLVEIHGQVDSFASPWEKLCQVVSRQIGVMEQRHDVVRTFLLSGQLIGDPRERAKWGRLLGYRKLHLNYLRSILEDGVKQGVVSSISTVTLLSECKSMAPNSFISVSSFALWGWLSANRSASRRSRLDDYQADHSACPDELLS